MGIGLCGFVVLFVSSNPCPKEGNLLAGDVNDDGETTVLPGLSHELRSDELGDGLREVDAVDEDVHCPSAQKLLSAAADIPSRISWNGPPFAVSFMSHLTMLSLHISFVQTRGPELTP